MDVVEFIMQEYGMDFFKCFYFGLSQDGFGLLCTEFRLFKSQASLENNITRELLMKFNISIMLLEYWEFLCKDAYQILNIFSNFYSLISKN